MVSSKSKYQKKCDEISKKMEKKQDEKRPEMECGKAKGIPKKTSDFILQDDGEILSSQIIKRSNQKSFEGDWI